MHGGQALSPIAKWGAAHEGFRCPTTPGLSSTRLEIDMAKSQEQLDARCKAKGLALARKLNAAVEACREFREACTDCGSGPRAADDTRITLPGSMEEYAGWLESVYGK